MDSSVTVTKVFVWLFSSWGGGKYFEGSFYSTPSLSTGWGLVQTCAEQSKIGFAPFEHCRPEAMSGRPSSACVREFNLNLLGLATAEGKCLQRGPCNSEPSQWIIMRRLLLKVAVHCGHCLPLGACRQQTKECSIFRSTTTDRDPSLQEVSRLQQQYSILVPESQNSRVQ